MQTFEVGDLIADISAKADKQESYMLVVEIIKDKPFKEPWLSFLLKEYPELKTPIYVALCVNTGFRFNNRRMFAHYNESYVEIFVGIIKHAFLEKLN